MKRILLSAMAMMSLATTIVAQTVPSYVPTNGLVGYWGFDGDANDYSGNNNHGTVNGATLTTDRNGVANKAYSFDGVNDNIDCGNGPNLNQFSNALTVAAWVKAPTSVNTDKNILSKYGCNPGGWSLETAQNTFAVNFTGCGQNVINQNSLYTDLWTQVIGVRENNKWKIYINGFLADSSSVYPNYNLNSGYDLIVGVQNDNLNPSTYWEGKIDDIAIYNRALTQQEVTALYTGCNLNASITPIKANVKAGDNYSFTASATDGSATFQWQTQPAETQWMNVPTNQKYNGATTKTLTLNNVQLSNHNQPFRVIATAGNCKDTSDVATIQIADTCLITVHDTLVINRTITGLTPPNNKNTIKVYPNPAKDHVIIHYGNFAMMNGYSVKITNTLGQELFASPINQQTSSVNLSNWNSHSLYFIHIIDPQGKTVEIRKILIE